MTITEQLKKQIRQALKKDTLYRIAKDSDVSWPVLNRFVTGERPTLRSDSLDKLCTYFCLELKKKSRRSPSRS